MYRSTCQRLCVAIVLSLSLGVPVCAGDTDANTAPGLFDMPIEDLMNVEVQKVYGASKREQKVSEAPASITIVTREEIKRFGYRTLADILEGTRSFFTTYDRNYQYVGIRGFGRPADYNNRVLILLDGHRLNDNIAGGSAIGADLPLDVDLIDRVEIIRGPGSSLYGTNAQFGVINIVTKSGRDYNTLEVKGEGASFDTGRGRATYGEAFDGGPDVLVSATGFDSDGPTLHYSEFDDPSTHFGNVHHDGQRYSDFFAKVSYESLTFTAARVSMEKEIPTAPWGVIFADPHTTARDDRTLLGLSYLNEIAEDFTVSAHASCNLYDYRGWYAYDWAVAPDPPDVVINKDLWDGRWWIGDLTFTKQLPGGHQLTWGTESQYNQRQEQKNWDRDVYLHDVRNSWNWALFAEDEFPILDKLLLNVGARFDEYVHQARTTNPRVGLIYKHSDETTLKALYGTAFRAPTDYELYYQDGGSTTKASPDLRPEKMDTAELVIEHRLDKSTSVAMTGFYYQLDHLIEQWVDPSDGLLVFRNGDTVIGKGAEIEVTRLWKGDIKTTGSYSYTESEYQDISQRPANSPRHLAKLRVLVPLIDKKLFVGIEPLYRGDVRTLSGRTAGGFTLVNLTFTYDGIVKNLDAGLSIYNLFDKRYGYPGGAEHVQDILHQDGITAAFRLTYRF
jgi:outer membrane receptor for ferrienterochelin and colicins